MRISDWSSDVCSSDLLPALDDEVLHFAILDDVDAQRRSCAGIAPGDGIVPRRPTARLVDAAEDGEARIGVTTWNLRVNAWPVVIFRVDAVEQPRVRRAPRHLAALPVVRGHTNAALQKTDVVSTVTTRKNHGTGKSGIRT